MQELKDANAQPSQPEAPAPKSKGGRLLRWLAYITIICLLFLGGIFTGVYLRGDRRTVQYAAGYRRRRPCDRGRA